MSVRAAALGLALACRLAAGALAAGPLVAGVLVAGVVTAEPAAAAPKKTNSSMTPEDVAAAFSDEEIIDGFMRTVYGAEGKSTKADTTRLHKFTGPVKVYIVNTAMIDRRDRITHFIRVLGRTINNLSIRMVKRRDDANMVIYLMNRSDYTRVIRETLPEGFDTGFLESNHCSAVTGGKKTGVLDRASVFIAASENWPQFRHCMVEEITQSLGPVNDDSSLAYSIYNDYSDVPGFGIFDWFILNALYDRRVKPGMTAEEVRPILPKAIADARKRLARLVAAKVIETGSGAPKP